MRILRAGLLLVYLLLQPFIVQAAPDAMGKSKVTAKAVCDKLFDAYQKGSQEAFSSLISDQFFPSKEEFMKAVVSTLMKETVLGVDTEVMMALTPGNRMVVQVRWNKKYQPKDGETPTLSTGIALLTFIKEKKAWQLSSVSGDSPF